MGRSFTEIAAERGRDPIDVFLDLCAAHGDALRWYTVMGLAAGVLLVLGGLSLKSTGFFSPLGSMTFIAFLGLLVWTLATCWIVWMAAPEEVPGAVTA